MIRAVLAELLDLVYPPRCPACGGATGGPPFCPECAEALEPPEAGCARCGEPGPLDPCGACLARPPPFAEVRAGGLFGGPLAEAIHALKYGGRPAVARPLGRWLAGRVALPAAAVIVPVPLARRRRIARGYDQAALVAGHLAREAGRRRLRGALRRIRETPPQVGRGRAARARNVAGAFLAAPAVAGLEIVLVDDVVTTGATVAAAAAALRAAGAARVIVAALARAE